MQSIRFKNNRLWYLDQTELPLKEVWRECRNLEQGFHAIKNLRVRGAPLIGVFAAYCVCVHLKHLPQAKGAFFAQLKKALKYLSDCRPTAVNLAWALEQLWAVAVTNKEKSLPEIKKALLLEVQLIHVQDRNICSQMAVFGLKLIKSGDNILTHCNTGFLATSGEGTALGVVVRAHKKYKNIKVYVDETRPLLQGARLTAWELMKQKVPAVLISDSMAAWLMQRKMIDKVLVGADRIASNGDIANKIGTYNVAVCAKYHRIPFYVVAPFSSFDSGLTCGKDIPIEERSGDEVRTVFNKVRIAPQAIAAFNPAFDVTPHELITAIVSDRGIIYPPFGKNIPKVLCPSKK